jgi:hypothetical protein
MATLFILSLVGFIGGAGAALCNPTNACPRLSDGLYCPVNDVTEHGDSNRDVKEIKDLLSEDTINYAGAKTVYTDGQYSSKGQGEMRTLEGLAKKDMTVNGKYTNVFFSGALDLHGSIDGIWHDYMVACLDGTGICSGKSDDFKTYIINKCAIGIVMGYATYEMGAAIWKAADGQLSDAGAPYAWDEAAAFYIGNIEPILGDGYTGSAPGNLYSPYEFLWKRDKDFPDGTELHTVSVPILNYGLLNIRTYDATNLASAQKAMYKIFAMGAIRSALKYSCKAYGGGTYSDKYHAEGWAYWRSASGYIATVNKSAVESIDAMLSLNLTSIPSTTPCTIKTILEEQYANLGITCAMVGKWKDAVSEGCSCLDSICDDTGNSNELISGSTSWVDMCSGSSSTPAASSARAMTTVSVAAGAAGATCAFAL